MPVFTSGKGKAPAWCELQYFDLVELKRGQTHRYERVGSEEKLIVGKGRCRIEVAGQEVLAEERANLDLPPGEGIFGQAQPPPGRG